MNFLGEELAISINRLPIFGTNESKVILCSCLLWSWISYEYMGGKMIAEKLLNKSNKFDIFEQINHLKIPGGNILEDLYIRQL